MARRKRCKDCGELREDVIGNLCERCEEYYEWCNVCKEHIHESESLHRHLFWTEDGYAGSGAYEGGWEHYCGDVHAFLSAIPVDLVIAIRHSIEAGKFNLFFTASLLGGNPHIWAELPLYYHWLHEYFDQNEFSESAARGLQWLFTLYKAETDKANTVTVGWIDEWLAARHRHETIMLYHTA
jgi:hypothetical protein